MPEEKKEKLTYKQQAFVDQYIICKGNALQAAKLAGYSGDDNTLAQRGHELVKNSKIQAAIAAKTSEIRAIDDISIEYIAKRLHEIEQDKTANKGDKLRALELLGKYKSMFVERIESVLVDSGPPMGTEERIRWHLEQANMLRQGLAAGTALADEVA